MPGVSNTEIPGEKREEEMARNKECVRVITTQNSK